MSEKSLVELIAHKRDGNELSAAEIERLISSYTSGALADYQMSALCMAIFFQGMSAAETAALTQAMLGSGEAIDLSEITRCKVDKHSTGGVGDKVSLCLAPLAAACGVAVPMISGRGLGHTGGTLDKLEAIPGFSVSQEIADFRRIVSEVGACIMGQTKDIVPADKRMYALRDVTATVDSIPLIVASILSKKLAAGLDGLVLDVKVGRGAFMKTPEQARRLAEALVSVGRAAGKRVSALLTDMSAPLGRAVGNAIETREALEVLQGGGPTDLIECTLALGAEMLRLAGLAKDAPEGEQKLREAVASGAGARVMQRMIEAQGGDPRVVDDLSLLPATQEQVEVPAQRAGFVHGIDALEIGLTSVAMGAGRSRADQPVDFAVGIELLVTRGEQVEAGQPLARLHVHERAAAEAPAQRVAGAFTIAEQEPPPPPPVVLDRILGSASPPA